MTNLPFCWFLQLSSFSAEPVETQEEPGESTSDYKERLRRQKEEFQQKKQKEADDIRIKQEQEIELQLQNEQAEIDRKERLKAEKVAEMNEKFEVSFSLNPFYLSKIG